VCSGVSMATWLRSCGNPPASTAYKLALPSKSISCEYRLLAGQECAYPFAVVAAFSITKQIVHLGVAQRCRRCAQPRRRLLVDSCSQGGTTRQAALTAHDILADVRLGQNAREQTLGERFLSAEDPTLEQNFERDRPASQGQQAAHFVGRHGEPKTIDGYTEPRFGRCNAQIALTGDLEPTAHTYAVNLGHHRMPAAGNGPQRRGQDIGVVMNHALEVGTLLRKLSDVSTRGKIATFTAQHHTAQGVVGRQFFEHLVKLLPHEHCDGVQAPRVAQCDDRDRPFKIDQNAPALGMSLACAHRHLRFMPSLGLPCASKARLSSSWSSSYR